MSYKSSVTLNSKLMMRIPDQSYLPSCGLEVELPS
jgi:hypothetical protein